LLVFSLENFDFFKFFFRLEKNHKNELLLRPEAVWCDEIGGRLVAILGLPRD